MILALPASGLSRSTGAVDTRCRGSNNSSGTRTEFELMHDHIFPSTSQLKRFQEHVQMLIASFAASPYLDRLQQVCSGEKLARMHVVGKTPL